MGVSPMSVFGYENHGRDALDTGFSKSSISQNAVCILFPGEKSSSTAAIVNPDVTESETIRNLQILSLRTLARSKLTAFGDVDRTHLRDRIDVGLLDQTRPAKFPSQLGTRLQSLLDTPGG